MESSKKEKLGHMKYLISFFIALLTLIVLYLLGLGDNHPYTPGVVSLVVFLVCAMSLHCTRLVPQDADDSGRDDEPDLKLSPADKSRRIAVEAQSAKAPIARTCADYIIKHIDANYSKRNQFTALVSPYEIIETSSMYPFHLEDLIHEIKAMLQSDGYTVEEIPPERSQVNSVAEKQYGAAGLTQEIYDTVFAKLTKFQLSWPAKENTYDK